MATGTGAHLLSDPPPDGSGPSGVQAGGIGGWETLAVSTSIMASSNEGKHILIVDDEEAVCWALRRALAQDGHSTAVTASAEEAFSLGARQRPDVIILDVRLPGMDGL